MSQPVLQLGEGRCNFCGRRRLSWSAPDTGAICPDCIRLCREVMDPGVEPHVERPGTRCSFCGRSHLEARRIVAGPGVYICNECVAAVPA